MGIIIGTLLFVFLGGVLYARIAAKYVQVSMEFAATIEKNEQTEGKLYVHFKKNIFFGKTKIFLQFENKMTGEIQCFPVRAFAGCGETVRIPVCLQMRYSGRIACTIEKIRVYDWLGITFATVYRDAKANVLVMPVLKACPQENMLCLENGRDDRKMTVHRNGYDYSEMSGIREYQSGDSMKSIHWKLTGRMDRLYVKEASVPESQERILFAETIHPKQPDGAFCDELTSELFSMCTRLLEQKISFTVVWYATDKEQLESVQVEAAQDIGRVLHQFMGCRQIQGNISGRDIWRKIIRT